MFNSHSKTQTIDSLNRLLILEYRSFPMYLTYASPWTHRGDQKAAETLQNIVADQQLMAQRIAELIDRLGGLVETGEYPMEFTDTHFLSLDFLLKELHQRQWHDVAEVERLVARLAGDREARELAEEALGMERAHLEAVEALLAQPVGVAR